MKRLLSLYLFAACAAAFGGAPPGACPTAVDDARKARAHPSDVPFDDAMKAFRSQRWSAAYGRFSRLAGQGDFDAARIALFMHRYGPVLFDSHWDASTEDLNDWTHLAASARGRPAPPYRPPGWQPMHSCSASTSRR